MEILKKSVTNRITLRIQNDVLEVLKNESEKKDLTLNALVNKILVKNVAYAENVNVVETLTIPHELFHVMVEKMKNSELIEIAMEGPRIVKKIFDIMGISYDIDHTIANYFIVLDKYCNWFEFSHKVTGSKYRLVFCTGSNDKWSGFIQNYVRAILESLKIVVSSESNSDGIIIFEFTHRDYWRNLTHFATKFLLVISKNGNEMLNQNETKEILSHVGTVEETKKIGIRLSTDFLRIVPNCTACGKEMQFVEGDIIYGEKWYHNKCLKSESGGRTNV